MILYSIIFISFFTYLLIQFEYYKFYEKVLLNQEEADLKASVREVEKNGIELA